MLHKSVETGKIDDKCNNPLNIIYMHVTKIRFISLLIKLDLLITTVGIITIGPCMLGTIFGIEIVMIACLNPVSSKL